MLTGVQVLQVGPGLAAAVAGRLLACLGATVTTIDPPLDSPLARSLNLGTTAAAYTLEANPDQLRAALETADLALVELDPPHLDALQLTPHALRLTGTTLAYITPFGLTGPRRDDPASDLTSIAASGIARLLGGQVDEPESEPPLRAVGQQASFIAGITAACAAIHSLLQQQRSGTADVIDVSIQEALACMVVRELAQVAGGRGETPRRRVADGGGATVTILPSRDGHVAISPRERHQWAAWLDVMNQPDWAEDSRFADRKSRIENWDELHALLSDWSRSRGKESIAEAAQAAHVPSFPLRAPAEHLNSGQLAQRGFFQSATLDGVELQLPGLPFGMTARDGEPAKLPPASLPLDGLRVLDFSWVIAGPTCTRYLAAMGADVIKIEAPNRPDPGRASELHSVLGQTKRAIALDLKQPEAVRIALDLAAESDIVVENFATGVMDRLGIGEEALCEANPNLVLVSASGVGRTGPEADRVAYGTLLQCYTGFAALNGHPGRPPHVGMAWLDPMCGLMLALVSAAAVFDRQATGRVQRVDFSMVEAMLWTMAEPLIDAQLSLPVEARGNASPQYAPHGIYPADGDDAWISLVVRDDAEWLALIEIVPGLEGLHGLGTEERRERAALIDQAIAAWASERPPDASALVLQAAGLAADAVVGATALLDDEHLSMRDFWQPPVDGVRLPGLPWRTTLPLRSSPARALGADTDAVLAEVLALDEQTLRQLRDAGAFGD